MRIYTEIELIEFGNYLLEQNKDYIKCNWPFVGVSDADLRNFFGEDYDSIKIERKQKLEKLWKK